MDNIDSYLQELKINKCSENTIKNIEYFWKERKINDKPPSEWTKEDVNQCILSLMTYYKPSTVETYKKYLKQYFNWCGKSDIVKHIKIKTIDTPIVRTDLPTIKEINDMVETTTSPFYKAMIALLFESGARISELLDVKVTDVVETDKGMIVYVQQTKTGIDKRAILCLYSGQYIRNLIMYGGLSKEEYLFKSPDNPDKPIWSANARETIKRIAKKAGINKKITPHVFRHAQATDMLVQGYQETIINKKLGWKAHSNVSARYKHCINDDVINATISITAKSNGNNVPVVKPIDTLKQPEEMTIATTTSILSRLNEENMELAEVAHSQEQQISELKKQMDSMQNFMKNLITAIPPDINEKVQKEAK
jgi:integrase/recombinase XerD